MKLCFGVTTRKAEPPSSRCMRCAPKPAAITSRAAVACRAASSLAAAVILSGDLAIESRLPNALLGRKASTRSVEPHARCLLPAGSACRPAGGDERGTGRGTPQTPHAPPPPRPRQSGPLKAGQWRPRMLIRSKGTGGKAGSIAPVSFTAGGQAPLGLPVFVSAHPRFRYPRAHLFFLGRANDALIFSPFSVFNGHMGGGFGFGYYLAFYLYLRA